MRNPKLSSKQIDFIASIISEDDPDLVLELQEPKEPLGLTDAPETPARRKEDRKKKYGDPRSTEITAVMKKHGMKDSNLAREIVKSHENSGPAGRVVKGTSGGSPPKAPRGLSNEKTVYHQHPELSERDKAERRKNDEAA